MDNVFDSNIIQSYLMGGFECCDMLNKYGKRVDLLEETNHITHIDIDYKNLQEHNITTVREGIRWSKVELKPYEYNWEDVEILIRAGQKQGIQQIWDICHFGMPDDLSPLHPEFSKRFSAVCLSFLKFYRSIVPAGLLIMTPINEVSFLSWLGGEVGNTTPFTKGYGWEVKYALTKAYIKAIHALKEYDDKVVILTTEPLVDIVPEDVYNMQSAAEAKELHEAQYQVTDMLLGKICPELQGNDDLVDIIGLNFYYSNRFSKNETDVISWINEFGDERFRPLNLLLEEAYNRYKKPIILSETSHPNEHRDIWFRHIVEETEIIKAKGIPLWGICWYPVLNRPDWDEPDFWHESGIWDPKHRTMDQCALHHEPLTQILKSYHQN